jgi:flagellar hook protein FlgE
MSLFGSLFTGVSALTAQSQKTSIISNNIANLNTTGFKRSEAAFQSFVTNNSSSTLFSPGTVASERIQRVTEQGPIQQSSSNTDVAISGNGFFVTKSDTNPDQEFQYTRNGQFSETSEGLLRNAAGQFLYGWRLGQNGALPAGRDDLSSLDPVNVSLQSNNTQPTSQAEFSVNLDKGATGEAVLPASNNKGGIIKDTEANFERGLTVFDSQGSPQQLNFSINKSYGPSATANSKPNSVGMEFSSELTENGMTNGDVFTIQAQNGGTILSGGSKTYEVETNNNASATTVNTVGELIEDINTNLNGVDAFLGNEGELIVQRTEFQDGDERLFLDDTAGAAGTDGSLQGMGLINNGAGTQTFDSTDFNGRNTFTGSQQSETGGAVNGSTVLTDPVASGGLGMTAGQDLTITDHANSDSHTFTVNSGDTLNTLITSFNSSSLGSDMTLSAPSAPATGELSIQHNNANAQFTLEEEDTTPGNGWQQLGLIENPFANGQQSDSPSFSGEAFPPLQNQPGDTGYNARGWWQVQINNTQGQEVETGMLNFNRSGQLNAPDGDQIIELSGIDWGNGTELQDIDIDISGFSQVDGDFTVNFSDQNGAAVGRRTGVEINQQGIVSARFSNGTTSDLFQLPLATFANANGLTEESGTSFTESAESGEENLREAGEGGAGLIEPGTLENSNVDLADEFSKLIVSQRAYSAGTRVITTIDQMTQELLRIQR